MRVVTQRPTRARRTCDATRRTFRTFVVVTCVIAALGLVRVWLSVQAAEASLEAGQLREDIKKERYRGDMLEIQQSALSSPSRIRALASATMDMVSVRRVSYLDLPAESVVRVRQERDSSAIVRALEDAASLAAGEAQVLLVGDVGLASAR